MNSRKGVMVRAECVEYTEIWSRGPLHPFSGVLLLNPITSLDNDPCTLVIPTLSFFLLSVLTTYTYTLFHYVLVTSSQLTLIQWEQNML